MQTLIDILALVLAMTAGLVWFSTESILGLKAWKRVLGIGFAYGMGLLGGVLFIANHYDWQMGGILALIGGLFLPFLLLAYAVRNWMLGRMADYLESHPSHLPHGHLRDYQQRGEHRFRQYIGREAIPPRQPLEYHPQLTVAVLLVMVGGTVLGGIMGFTYSIFSAVLSYVGLSIVYFLTVNKMTFPAGLSKWNVYYAFAFVWGVSLLFIWSFAK